MVVLLTGNKSRLKKIRRSIVAIKICNKLFDALCSPVLLYNSEICEAYDSINFEKWEKDTWFLNFTLA